MRWPAVTSSPSRPTVAAVWRGLPTATRGIRVFGVGDSAHLSGGRVLIDAGDGGTPDGLRVDVDDNLWCSWGMGSAELDGVRVLAPDVSAIGHIDLPERCADLCCGGRWRDRLFMAASHGVYAPHVNAQGRRTGDIDVLTARNVARCE